MKKIYYIANIRLPTEKAHGIQVMKMCEAFARQGTKVELVVPRRLNPIKDDTFEYYGVERNFTITRLPTIDLVRFGKIGFFIQAVSFAKLAWLYLLFQKRSIVYGRDEIALFFALFTRHKVFWEAHMGHLNFFARYVARQSKGVITISHGLANVYVKAGIVKEKILVAPDGVDLDNFDIQETKEECREKLQFPQDKKIVLYAGHLYEWKGVHTLACAAKNLPKDQIVVFVGGAKEDVEAFRKKCGNDGNIYILGQKPHKDIPRYLKAADVLVLPNTAQSKMSREYTSPMKLFEYMASGTPIVASDLPSLREILNDETAIFFIPDDPHSLACIVMKVLKDTQLQEKKENSCRVIKEYTWKGRSKKIISFIEHACAN